MNADNQNQTQPCTCELCQPNWFMGRDGMTFTPQPVKQESQQDELERAHARKLVREFVPAMG